MPLELISKENKRLVEAIKKIGDGVGKDASLKEGFAAVVAKLEEIRLELAEEPPPGGCTPNGNDFINEFIKESSERGKQLRSIGYGSVGDMLQDLKSHGSPEAWARAIHDKLADLFKPPAASETDLGELAECMITNDRMKSGKRRAK
jgi:hypothetical protein